MALTIGKRDVQRLAKVMDLDYESLDEAAEAVLAEAFEIYEAKAKWTVVGQLYWSGRKYLNADDAAASKVCLGNYSTAIQAHDAASKLVISKPTGESFLAWALEVHHGTPNDYFKKRLEAAKAAAIKARSGTVDTYEERLDWFKANPDALTYQGTEG